MFNLGKFKDGQFNITDSLKSKSDTGFVISIHDDVTTYIYEKDDYFKMSDLESFLINNYESVDYNIFGKDEDISVVINWS